MVLLRLLKVIVCCLQITLLVANGDSSCDGCTDKLDRQLEKAARDLSGCNANLLAIETRESVFKENAASCEEKRKSMEQIASELTSKLEEALKKQSKDQDNFQIEREALLQTVATLKEAQRGLQEKYDAAIQDHRSATETQQIRHAQQLELVMSHNTKLESELVEATNALTTLQEINIHMKSEVESLKEQKIAALDDAEKSRSKLTAEHSSCEVSLSSLQEKLQESHKACESQVAAINDQMTNKQEGFQSTIDKLRQTHSEATTSLQESCEGKLSEQERSCSTKIIKLKDQKEQLEASMTSKLVEIETDCKKQKEELKTTLKEEVDRNLMRGIEIGKNKTSTGIRRLKLLNSKLQESQRSLLDQTDDDAARLRQLKEELFEIRRELFLANEKLREPTIRHRTRMKRVRAVIGDIMEFISPFHHAYIMPLWVPIYHYITKAITIFKREHLPSIQATAATAVGVSRDRMSHCYQAILLSLAGITKLNVGTIFEATDRERRLLTDSFLNVYKYVLDETFFPFYVKTLKPAIDTHWLPLYQTHFSPAWKTFTLALSPYLVILREYWTLGIHYHNGMQERVAKSLQDLADIVSDYGHLQNYLFFARICERIRDRSTDIVFIVESLCVGGVLVATLIVIRSRQRHIKTID